jgi:TorA maturation chaperone TorD
MLKFAQTDFYRALAYLTRGYIEVDKEFLENILSEELEAERVA